MVAFDATSKCRGLIPRRFYAAGENGETYNKFFGGVGAFKKNWLKQARRKRLE